MVVFRKNENWDLKTGFLLSVPECRLAGVDIEMFPSKIHLSRYAIAFAYCAKHFSRCAITFAYCAEYFSRCAITFAYCAEYFSRCAKAIA